MYVHCPNLSNHGILCRRYINYDKIFKMQQYKTAPPPKKPPIVLTGSLGSMCNHWGHFLGQNQPLSRHPATETGCPGQLVRALQGNDPQYLQPCLLPEDLEKEGLMKMLNPLGVLDSLRRWHTAPVDTQINKGDLRTTKEVTEKTVTEILTGGFQILIR